MVIADNTQQIRELFQSPLRDDQRLQVLIALVISLAERVDELELKVRYGQS